MSRIYISASLAHSSFGLPVFSVETTDHTGGGYAVKGIHPVTLAHAVGRGPKVGKGERFDIKANVNAKRISIALVINTSIQLPHLEWSSEGGLGKLPLGLSAFAPGASGGRKGADEAKWDTAQKERKSHGRDSELRPHRKRRSKGARHERETHRHGDKAHAHRAPEAGRDRLKGRKDVKDVRRGHHSHQAIHADSGMDEDEDNDVRRKRARDKSQGASQGNSQGSQEEHVIPFSEQGE